MYGHPSLARPFLLTAPQTPELSARSTQEIFFASGGSLVLLQLPQESRYDAAWFSIRSVYTGLSLFSVYGRVNRAKGFKK